jgi:hypothetical protein
MESPVRWNEVQLQHRTDMAVRVSDGYVLSLLCGQERHANAVSEERIEYVIPARPFYSAALRAFQANQAAARAVRVFQKRAVNDWHDIGHFRVLDVVPGAGEHIVVLVR